MISKVNYEGVLMPVIMAGFLMIGVSTTWAVSAISQESDVTMSEASTASEEDESHLASKGRFRSGGMSRPMHSSPPRSFRPTRTSMHRYTGSGGRTSHQVVRHRPPQQRLIRNPAHRYEPSPRSQHRTPSSFARHPTMSSSDARRGARHDGWHQSRQPATSTSDVRNLLWRNNERRIQPSNRVSPGQNYGPRVPGRPLDPPRPLLPGFRIAQTPRLDRPVTLVSPRPASVLVHPSQFGNRAVSGHDAVGHRPSTTQTPPANTVRTGPNAVSNAPQTVRPGRTHEGSQSPSVDPQRTGTGAPGSKPQTPNIVSTVKPQDGKPSGKPEKPNTISTGNSPTDRRCTGPHCHKRPHPPCRGPHCPGQGQNCRGPKCPKPPSVTTIISNRNTNVVTNFTLPADGVGGGEVGTSGEAPVVDVPPEEAPAEPAPAPSPGPPGEPTSQTAVSQGPSPADLISQGISDSGQGNYAAAERRFKLALDILQSTRDSNPALIASALENLALVYDQAGRAQESAEAREMARKIRERA